jgi:hypothetical protein
MRRPMGGATRERRARVAFDTLSMRQDSRVRNGGAGCRAGDRAAGAGSPPRCNDWASMPGRGAEWTPAAIEEGRHVGR